MSTSQEKIQRGLRAEKLLREEVFDEAIADLRSVLYSELETFTTDDPAPVMAIMRQLRGLRHLRSRLEGWKSEARTLRIQAGDKVSD